MADSHLAYYRQLLHDVRQYLQHDAKLPSSHVFDPSALQLLQGCAYLLSQQQAHLKHYQLQACSRMIQSILPVAAKGYASRVIAQANSCKNEAVLLPGNTNFMANKKYRFKSLCDVVIQPLVVSRCHFQPGSQNTGCLLLSLKNYRENLFSLEEIKELIFYIDDPFQNFELLYCLLQCVKRVAFNIDGQETLLSNNCLQMHYYNAEATGNEIEQCIQMMRDFVFFDKQYCFFKLSLDKCLMTNKTFETADINIYFHQLNIDLSFIRNETIQLNCMPLVNHQVVMSEPITADESRLFYPVIINHSTDNQQLITLNRATVHTNYEDLPLTLVSHYYNEKQWPHLFVDPNLIPKGSVISAEITVCDGELSTQLFMGDKLFPLDAQLQQMPLTLLFNPSVFSPTGDAEQLFEIVQALNNTVRECPLNELFLHKLAALVQPGLFDDINLESATIKSVIKSGVMHEVLFYDFNSSKSSIDVYFKIQLLHRILSLLAPINMLITIKLITKDMKNGKVFNC